jgi:hypothetical protein
MHLRGWKKRRSAFAGLTMSCVEESRVASLNVKASASDEVYPSFHSTSSRAPGLPYIKVALIHILFHVFTRF